MKIWVLHSIIATLEGNQEILQSQLSGEDYPALGFNRAHY